MRSTKSRSRNKSNRQRSLGNVVNRVFDSSGPEGKVRGTPQQIIEKYLTLARDAQLSNDRVAEQSFLQHAEHYTRMLGEALREQAERQQQSNQRDDDARDDSDGGFNHNHRGNHGNGNARNGSNQNRDRGEQPQPSLAPAPQPSEAAPAEEVEAVEPVAPRPAAAAPRTRTPRPAASADSAGLPAAIAGREGAAEPVETPEAGLFDADELVAEEAPRPAPRRRATRSTAAAAPRTRKKPAEKTADSGPSKEPVSEG